jgi:microcystin-dependent protein
MATTTNFSLNKPTVGGDENTWGGLTNDNWDDVDNLLRIAMPAGGIIMWSGSVASIPTGWLLCDGTSGTPDLTGRFVVHADADSGGTYDVGDTGGADSVTLAEANLPSHTHSFSATTGAGGNHQHTGTTASDGGHRHYVLNNDNVNSFGGWVGTFLSRTNTFGGNDNYQLGGSGTEPFLGFTSENGAHSHTFTTSTAADHTHTVSGTTGATGSGTAIDNRPAFYALAYIMKAA